MFKNTNTNTNNNKTVSNWLHGTYKGKDSALNQGYKKATQKGLNKIKKIDRQHLLNPEVLESFNLNEKERFRQLIAQNLNKKTIATGITKIEPQNRNLYQKFIHTTPSQIRDDSTLQSAGLQMVQPWCVANQAISRSYSRRISLSSTDSPTANYNAHSNVTVIELDQSPSVSCNVSGLVSKVAKKRNQAYYGEANGQEIGGGASSESSSSGGGATSGINVIESLKNETNQFYANINMKKASSVDGSSSMMNEKERKWNEKMKDLARLQEVFKKSQQKSNNVMKEEERYLHKKRQRMEKERVEKELAEKFSQQLYLDSNRLNIYEQEEVEIDEFPEFTEDQEKCIKASLNPNPANGILITGFNVEITRRDIQTLKGLNWLNDEIINFYMNLIVERSTQNNNNNEIKVYALSTFFYPKLIKDGYASIRRWTKKVDLFSHNLVLAPIHLGLHWTLACIDFDCKEIRYYDSMNGNNGECLKALRSYLRDEYADKKVGAPQLDIAAWNCIHVKDVPQQMNGSDCGMFACKYAEFLSRVKAIGFNQSHMAYYRRRMIWEIVNKKLM
jgi:sentrin-specific protease 1